MNLIQVLSEVYPTLLQGLGMTVQITVLSLLIAMVLGIFVCLMNISHNVVLRGIAKFGIWGSSCSFVPIPWPQSSLTTPYPKYPAYVPIAREISYK